MTDRYAVIGNPISQTKSPILHALFAKQTGADLSYEAILGPMDAFESCVKDFIAKGGKGMNITVPFKLKALAMATDKREAAKLAGATNCLKFENGAIIAENFDGVGLVNDIQQNIKYPLTGKRVLILGAGGAVRGALLPIMAQKPAELVIANRTLSRVQQLKQDFAGVAEFTAVGYPDVKGQSFDAVLNATSASLFGEVPAIDESVFRADGLAYDLAYGKGLTPFLKLAKKAGVTRIADGVGMLVEQAAEAFVWWRGIRPDTSEAIKTITVPLV